MRTSTSVNRKPCPCELNPANTKDVLNIIFRRNFLRDKGQREKNVSSFIIIVIMLRFSHQEKTIEESWFQFQFEEEMK